MKWVIWVLYMDVHVHVEWMDEMGNMGTVHGCTCTCRMDG